MKELRFIRGAWALLLVALVLGVSVITPALASSNTQQHHAATQPRAIAGGTSIPATIYVTLSSIEPQFQARIDQDVPQSFSNAITTLIGKLPQQDQGWALQMATTLIQPSGSLQSLVTQQNGLAMTVQISLYSGDPKPTVSTMLISFSVLDSSTIQVSASPVSGPALSSGPLETITIPIGILNAVNTTPNCGDAALGFNLQIPVALKGQSTGATTSTASVMTHGNPMATLQRDSLNNGVNTFVEIPAASLAALSGSLGTIDMGNSLTAQNISIVVQSGAIHILSDVYWSGLNVGTADSTLVPGASNGNLVMHVTSTNFNLFGLFQINENSYDQQIEQLINAKLGNAFAGEFSVSQAQIGPNSHLPCAKSDSLVLTGASSIG
ncbi:MAG TPA: hypothetical protein VGT44_20615 [Ktedonobacteraceae bacterium]|nr:hypothetical protein [Ktedonobacteraceae bacterium]